MRGSESGNDIQQRAARQGEHGAAAAKAHSLCTWDACSTNLAIHSPVRTSFDPFAFTTF